MMVINILKHADDCTSEFVYYQNLDKTFDSEPGEKWLLSVETFLSRFTPVKKEKK